MDISHNQDRFLLYLCVCHIIGLSKVITSPDNPDIRTEGAESRLTLWGTSDSANNAI